LIIGDEESGWKRCRVMASLTDDEEDEEDEIPLTHRQRVQGALHTLTPPRAPTPPQAAMPPRAPTPPPSSDTDSDGHTEHRAS
jgi:hypothetical protein